MISFHLKFDCKKKNRKEGKIIVPVLLSMKPIYTNVKHHTHVLSHETGSYIMEAQERSHEEHG